MIESELYEFFSQYPEFYNLIGDSSGFRFYPDFAPEEVELPLVVYASIHYSGEVGYSGDMGIRDARTRFNILGRYLSECQRISAVMEGILHGKVLKMGSLKTVQPVLTSGHTVYDEDPGIRRIVIDYNFSYLKGVQK